MAALITTGNALECIGFSEIAAQRYNFLAKQANIYRFFWLFVSEFAVESLLVGFIWHPCRGSE